MRKTQRLKRQDLDNLNPRSHNENPAFFDRFQISTYKNGMDEALLLLICSNDKPLLKLNLSNVF